jgi:hypothetical protein
MDTKRYTLTFPESKVVLVQVTLMKDSCQIWLGSADSGVVMNNMTASMSTRFGNAPMSTSLVSSGDEAQDSFSDSISAKLAHKLKAQVFVHCSLPPTYEALIPGIEQELSSLLPPLLAEVM